MSSVFAWLDHSEEQRRKVLDVIDLFREQGTVDELGLGTIRDAFADILFPGTSNLMTRASYYLFIPWMYLRLEAKRTPSAEVGAKAKREELALIERLLEAGETEGVIGRRARGGLQRRPSSIYWAGMKRLNVCLFDGSQENYHRSLDRFYVRQKAAIKTDDGERLSSGTSNWHARLPSPPADWPSGAKLPLATAQAEFLRDQIALAAPSSLLAVLTRATDAPADIEFPWEHPFQATFSAGIHWQLGHAQNISEVMHGAALLYNLILAEMTSKKDLVDEYLEKLRDWAEGVTARMGQLRSWDRTDAWKCVGSEGARVPRQTRDFVDRWCEMAIEGSPSKIPNSQQARLLVIQREKRLKGPLARVDNVRARERWQGASSAQRLQYRWGNASVIVDDIVTALHGWKDA